MNGQITRIEALVLGLILLLVVAPLFEHGGLGALLYESVTNSRLDPGLLASVRLGMAIILIVAVVKVLVQGKGGHKS
jgi:hypothetical protein